LVNILLAKYTELHKTAQSFVSFLKDKYQKEKLTQKLEKYYFLESTEFLSELKKAKIKASLKIEKELKSFFEEEKKSALDIYEIIQNTEKKLDNLIYELYRLDEKEIEIVGKF